MKTPIAVRNNNPLNIRWSPMNEWIGQIGENRGFVNFGSLGLGCRAALVLLRNYVKRGYDTIPAIISRWAPASENNTSAYIRYVVDSVALHLYDAPDAAASDFVRNMRITSLDTLLVVANSMACVEIGRGWLSHHPEMLERLDTAFSVAASEITPKVWK